MSSAGADPNMVTGGVIAGIVICSLLFLIVVALVAYNIYLWHRRRSADRDARQRQLNRKYDSGWRPSDGLYVPPQDDRSKRGSGNVNAAFAPSTAGSTVAGSTGSMSSRGVGPAPRAQYEDISDDEEDGTGSATRNGLHYHKPPRPTLQYQSPPAYNAISHGKRPPGIHNNVTGNTHAHTPPYSQSVPSPHARQEVTLRPQHLQAGWDRGVPPPVNGVGVGAQDFRAPQRPAEQYPQRRLPVADQRNSYLAVLSANTSRIRTSDVSLTGFGAQYVPSIGLKTSAHHVNGGLAYNDY